MPNTSSNVILYATKEARYPVINVPTATASTTTLLITAASAGTIVTDILWRTADGAARTWDIIICATGSHATAENARVMVSIPASSGNNGSTAIASLASLVPSLFDIDLAGNRVIQLEAGQSIYLKNNATSAGYNYITCKARDY
ncbi:MAG: hypothetical protein V4594_16680 [Bacteroidota bacterium]